MINYGPAMRGHAVMSDDMTGGYFNQTQTIAPIRKGPKLFRVKPKVDTDFIQCTLMNEADNRDRIGMWPYGMAARGVNHAVKVNYGAQVLNLTTGAQHYPTVPRKLEDEDYRPLDAKYRQDQLVPLSRMPRAITSIDVNRDASSVYNKPLSASDVEASRVKSSIKGNFRDLVKKISVDAPKTRDITNAAEYEQSANVLTQHTARDKLTGLARGVASKHITIGSNPENPLPPLKLRRLVAREQHTDRRQTVGALTAGQHEQLRALIKRNPLQTLQTNKQVDITSINDPNHQLLTKLKAGGMAAGRVVAVSDMDAQNAAKRDLVLNHKIVADERANNALRMRAIYTDADHEGEPMGAKLYEKIHGDPKVQKVYSKGYSHNLDTNLLSDHNMNVNYQRKNASCDAIDPSRYASERRTFERTLPGVKYDIPYHKGMPTVFIQTGAN